jgi:hypothetical protein
MHVRLLSVLLVFGLILAFSVGCQSETTTTKPVVTTTTKPITTTTADPSLTINRFGWTVPAETLTITGYNSSGNFNMSEEQKQGRANMDKILLEEFNVIFNMITTDGNGTEYLNLLLASGEYPEVIYNTSYENVLRLIDLGKTKELSAALEAYGQDIKKAIGDLYPLFLDAEKKLWYIPIGVGALMELPDWSAHVRWDEYKEIGSPKIATPDDYYNVIHQILERFPKTPAGESRYALSLFNRPADNVTGPMGGSLAGYWGIKSGWKVASDNSLTYWPFTEGGKAMTKWFNRFWTAGTMDPDAFANNFDEWKAKFSNERIVGAIGGWWITYSAGHEVWRLVDPNFHEDKRFVQVGFKAPEAEASYVTGKNKYGGSNTVITDKAQDVGRVISFINFQATEPGLALFNWGVPGKLPTYKDPNTKIRIWDIDESGAWAFDETSKEQLVSETFDHPASGVLGFGNYVLFSHVNRWADGVHCVWGNQMWYELNPWKTLLIQNMNGTIYDYTPMVLRQKSESVVLLETAIIDTWRQNWPLAVQAKNDAEFEQLWTAFQNAIKAAGIDEYTRIVEENYKTNITELG